MFAVRGARQLRNPSIVWLMSTTDYPTRHDTTWHDKTKIGPCREWSNNARYLRQGPIFLSRCRPPNITWFSCRELSCRVTSFNSFSAGDVILRPLSRHCFSAGHVIFRNNQVTYALNQHRDRANITNVSTEWVNVRLELAGWLCGETKGEQWLDNSRPSWVRSEMLGG